MNASSENMTPTVGPVVFGVPSYSHHVSLGFMKSMIATWELLNARKIAASVNVIGGDPFIAKARNRITTDFLLQCKGYDSLFFIDDDVDWQPEKVIEFLERPEDIVAGIYPYKSEQRDFPVQLLADGDTGELIEQNGLLKASLVPTGFLRIKRSVLERLALPPTRIFLDTMPGGVHREFYGIFEAGIAPATPGEPVPFWWGEDFIFCRKCLNLGIDIWVDPNMTMGHEGRRRWEDNMGANLDRFRRRAKVASKGDPTGAQNNRLLEAMQEAKS